nr:immunoglobulin light chain junction region [Macaca mulatta]MOV97211.1 immunoglobulin light chain junction region [Macaca mulatta]MOV98032.1 immunoglobulin light chain junction region [Macaca mulatta]MOW01244.1 immunoglobulin light chain junction region [Macaca mulatta]MOW01379.1 immunoglobulin light chain junction region [Macaca mulatta]
EYYCQVYDGSDVLF